MKTQLGLNEDKKWGPMIRVHMTKRQEDVGAQRKGQVRPQ